jgi:hypothetical protein
MILVQRDLENSWNGNPMPKGIGKNYEAVKQVVRILAIIWR